MELDSEYDVGPLPLEGVLPAEWPPEIVDSWIRGASRALQLRAMATWFHGRFWDPANDTPYSSADGGYIYVNGGPYDPADELGSRFGGFVKDAVIQELVQHLYLSVGHEWASIRTESGGWDYEFDEDFDVDVPSESAPLAACADRLADATSLLTIDGSPHTKALLVRSAYGSIITALEAFLWETVRYWVESDEGVLRRIVETTPTFIEHKIPLSKVFEQHELIKQTVAAYLQNLVWHRWDKVALLFAKGLEVATPPLRQFDAALQKRHDLVHRAGLTKDGQPVVIEAAEVEALAAAVQSFALAIHNACREKFIVPDF